MRGGVGQFQGRGQGEHKRQRLRRRALVQRERAQADLRGGVGSDVNRQPHADEAEGDDRPPRALVLHGHKLRPIRAHQRAQRLLRNDEIKRRAGLGLELWRGREIDPPFSLGVSRARGAAGIKGLIKNALKSVEWRTSSRSSSDTQTAGAIDSETTASPVKTTALTTPRQMNMWMIFSADLVSPLP